MKRDVRIALQVLIGSGIEELTNQGHVASGAGIKSFEMNVTEPSPGFIVGIVLVNEYVMKLNYPQPRQLVSISDLIRWAGYVKKGLSSEKDKLSFARRVRASIAKFGIPAPGAYAFSKNGRRTGWLEASSDEAEPKLEKIFTNSKAIELILDQAIFAATQRR